MYFRYLIMPSVIQNINDRILKQEVCARSWTCPNLRYQLVTWLWGMRITMKILSQIARHKAKIQTWYL